MINDETLKNIESLHRLKTEGVITPDDFEKAKDKLLNGTTRIQVRSHPTSAAAEEQVALPAPDDHFAWMTLPFKRYADFNRRSTRKEFWMFLLLINCIVFGLGSFVMVDIFTNYGQPSSFAGFFMIAIFLVIAGTFVPLLAVEARRFQDQEKSAWLVGVNLVPYLGSLVVLFLMALPGTKGENRYGPDPLA